MESTILVISYNQSIRVKSFLAGVELIVKSFLAGVELIVKSFLAGVELIVKSFLACGADSLASGKKPNLSLGTGA